MTDAITIIVLDIGGTNLRAGYFDADSGELHGVTRHAAVSFHTMPGTSVAEVQQAVLAQMAQVLLAKRRAAPNEVSGACISFAGPIAANGRTVGAPTLWGEGGEPLDIGNLLSAMTGLCVHVLNDVTAAAWRYANADQRPFCLITVSSGVGNKVFAYGRVLVNEHGYGGEIGHQRVDFSPDALPCDCGGRGHLGAVASGRGSVAVARRFAQEEPDAFRASLLAQFCGGDAASLTSYHIVQAVRDRDVFAERCVVHGIRFMARTVGGIYAAIGVDCYIFMGGFAQALGQRYLDLLVAELQADGMFGVEPHAIPAMLSMAEPDDDHGLVGAGRYFDHLKGETH
jgi:C7-cyclitol 7-kinase